MKNQYDDSRIVIAGLLLACLVVVTGCRGSSATPYTPPAGAPPPPGTEDFPTVAPLLTPTPLPGGQPGGGDVEGLTKYEQLAADAGQAVYSGYSCAITHVGCACETPVVELSSFTFVSDDLLHYQFEGSGYAALWEMERAGPNQWSYEMPLYNDDGTFQGQLFVLLTFHDSGFIYTLAGALGDEWIACPDVSFRRMD